MTNGRRTSDSLIVPGKPPNKGERSAAAPAEGVEGRGLAKGNSREPTRSRTQIREDLQGGLERIRQAAVRDRELQFTNLWFHITDVERLREAYLGLKREAAPGVDGVTWAEYGRSLEANLQDLSDRLKRGAYRARPVKRVMIPKPDGGQRPLGVTALEDKIAQRATVCVLNAVYETDFLGFSYGFRPGRNPHRALDALVVGIETKPVNWVVDCDIRGFFDAIDHDCLLGLVERRVKDVRVCRHIRKWLNAGVLEKGTTRVLEKGSPQGSSLSPLLANITLHYAFDVWAHEWRRQRATGAVIFVRYADDILAGFEQREDAERFLGDLQLRFAEFHLELHAEKTRIVLFGRKADNDWRNGRGSKPGTFDFLGFRHACDRTRRGNRFIVLRQTARSRLSRKLGAMKLWLRGHLHDPVPRVGMYLRRVILGHLQYFGVPRNGPALRAFIQGLGWLWYKSLRRRSQKTRMTWQRMYRLLRIYFPPPKIVHPYPNQRFAVMTQGKSPVR